jgi:phage gp36-like protein
MTLAYCSVANVQARLSDAGVLYCVDDNNDGDLDTEEQAVVEAEIQRCSRQIDRYLDRWVDTPLDAVPDDIEGLCVDLVAYRLSGRKGMQPPAIFVQAATDAREFLAEVKAGDTRVPGLTYPTDGFDDEDRVLNLPRAHNPK